MGRKGEHGKRLKEPCRRQWLHDAHRRGGAIKMVVRLEETEKDGRQRDFAREGERGFQREDRGFGLGLLCTR